MARNACSPPGAGGGITLDNRETYLGEAAVELREWILDLPEGQDFELPLVSVGFPKGSRGRGKAIGQCHDKTTSGDKVRAHVFISPEVKDKVEVLRILLHELIHASVGTQCGHRKEFRKLALALGFKQPMTSTPAGAELQEQLEYLAKKLGDYPHPGLNYKQRKGGTRMLKVYCGACGCVARMTRKWLDYVGPPTCGCGTHYRMQEEIS